MCGQDRQSRGKKKKQKKKLKTEKHSLSLTLCASLSFPLCIFVWWSHGSKYSLLQKPMYFALTTMSSHSQPAETVLSACYFVFCRELFFLFLLPALPSCPPPLALHLPSSSSCTSSFSSSCPPSPLLSRHDGARS